MRTLTVLTLVCFVTWFEAVTAQGYFWIPWDKKVPNNAVEGGVDHKGRKIYIGLGYYYNHQDKDVLPSVLFEGEQAHSHLGPFFLDTDLAWVLAYDKSNPPIWRAIQLERQDEMLGDCKPVIGGHCCGTHLMIGRIRLGNKILIGKVFPSYHQWKGLEIWDETRFGNDKSHFGGYKDIELLVSCPGDNLENKQKPFETDHNNEGGLVEALPSNVSCISCLLHK